MYKTISFFKVSLITYHKYSCNTNLVHILVQHSILFTRGYRMVPSMAGYTVYKHFINQENYRLPCLQLCLSYWAASSGVILQ